MKTGRQLLLVVHGGSKDIWRMATKRHRWSNAINIGLTDLYYRRVSDHCPLCPLCPVSVHSLTTVSNSRQSVGDNSRRQRDARNYRSVTSLWRRWWRHWCEMLTKNFIHSRHITLQCRQERPPVTLSLCLVRHPLVSPIYLHQIEKKNNYGQKSSVLFFCSQCT